MLYLRSHIYYYGATGQHKRSVHYATEHLAYLERISSDTSALTLYALKRLQTAQYDAGDHTAAYAMLAHNHDYTTSMNARAQKQVLARASVDISLDEYELITNAYKYAFPKGKSGKVAVEFTKNAGKFLLCVSDNVVGLPSDAEIRQSNPLGLNLVNGLVRQLDRTIKWSKGIPGTEVAISF
jgi:two-component sensor histidine kinase